MIKTVVKTLSLSFGLVAVAMAALASASDSPARGKEAASAATALSTDDLGRVGCSVRPDVDRGWEYQQELIDARMAARQAEGLSVPGAIISPLFTDFAPPRTDVSAAKAEPKTPKAVKGVRRRRPAS